MHPYNHTHTQPGSDIPCKDHITDIISCSHGTQVRVPLGFGFSLLGAVELLVRGALGVFRAASATEKKKRLKD